MPIIALVQRIAGQESRDVTARVRRAKQAAHERAGLPHLIGQARERHTLPNRRPSHPRTRPFPGHPPTDTPGQQPDARKCTLHSAANVKPQHTRPIGHLRPCAGQIRASSVHAHRSLGFWPLTCHFRLPNDMASAASSTTSVPAGCSRVQVTCGDKRL